MEFEDDQLAVFTRAHKTLYTFMDPGRGTKDDPMEGMYETKISVSLKYFNFRISMKKRNHTKIIEHEEENIKKTENKIKKTEHSLDIIQDYFILDHFKILIKCQILSIGLL